MPGQLALPFALPQAGLLLQPLLLAVEAAGGGVSASMGILSRAECDKRSASSRVQARAGGLDFAVEWPEDEADAETK